jgi:ATP-binding cassette, subfamily F, member 3
MLHVNDITLRLGPRVLFDKAAVALPPNTRVGFVGRQQRRGALALQNCATS